MHLQHLRLINFKNYLEAELSLDTQINCFVGLNGGGKTNLLDAIHYLCISKSAFNSSDQQSIFFEMPFMMMEGEMIKEGKAHRILCSLKVKDKKKLKVDKQDYDKLAEHIGRFPCVLIAPNDASLIREGSEVRRRFFDGLFSQIDQEYLNTLIQYNQLLKKRNAALKYFFENRCFDEALLATYTEPLLEHGIKIYQRRSTLVQEYLPIFLERYEALTQASESISLFYKHQFQDRKEYLGMMTEALEKDRALQRTTIGIHKDDFVLQINDHPVKKFGSQGQQKSTVIALKLAMYDMIRQYKKSAPILLLDDIFDKLDQNRVSQLLQIITHDTFGQIFITDTNLDRTIETLKGLGGVGAKIFCIKEGTIQDTKVLNT